MVGICKQVNVAFVHYMGFDNTYADMILNLRRSRWLRPNGNASLELKFRCPIGFIFKAYLSK